MNDESKSNNEPAELNTVSGPVPSPISLNGTVNPTSPEISPNTAPFAIFKSTPSTEQENDTDSGTMSRPTIPVFSEAGVGTVPEGDKYAQQNELLETLLLRNRELDKQNQRLQKKERFLQESLKKYSELYDLAPMIYLTINKKGRILDINKTGADMLGTPRETLLLKPILAYMAIESHDVFIHHYQEVFKTRDMQNCELKLITESDTEFYGHLESMCVKVDGPEKPDRFRTLITDITSRKRMELALRESKLKNLAILNTIPDIIFIQDESGVYIDYHAENLETLCIPPIEFLGKYSGDILPQSIAAPLDDLMKLTLKTGELHEFEYSLPYKKGVRFYETRMARLGKDKVLSIVRDITRSKQTEMALQAAHNMLERRVDERTAEIAEINRQLTHEINERKRMEKVKAKAQRMETLGRLAAGVAHEVRNPLNSIQAIFAVLNQDLGDNEEFRSCSTHINTQVQRLAQLMKDLLDLAKLDKHDEYKIIESIPELCMSAVDLWKQSHKKVTHNVIVTNASEAAGSMLKGDMGKLQQVIINLLDNASQHSPKGSDISLDIHKPINNTIRIDVVDKGTGIKPEFLSQVFEPFFTKRHTGTGLGLSIVKNIVENHSGTIRILNNDPPPGSTFAITLPLAVKE